MTKYLGINIDYARDKEMTEQGYKLVCDYYLAPHEQSPQEAYARASVAFSDGDLQLAQRLYDGVSQGWFMFSSPILSNAPDDRHNNKGMPISCFLNYVDDSLQGLIDHTAETRWLSVKGGGVGGHWSAVRSVSNKSPGTLPFLKTMNEDMNAYRQGKTRKGSYAAYMDVSHPDISGFLNMRLPTGGDDRFKCLDIHHAINITNSFMNAVESDDAWELKCPDSGEVKETMKARQLWERILEVRSRTGEPYLNFIDTANDDLNDDLKDLGLKIHGSNLCNEIHLPTSEDRTAVCCLSSLNIEKFDEWKDTQIVGDLIEMLDNVLTYFIDNAPEVLHKAVKSAIHQRDLGLGAMGFHSLLQRRGIPWESPLAKSLNKKVFDHIKSRAYARSLSLGITKGPFKDFSSQLKRNAHLLAIAPNANSSIICGTSASIEPIKSNAYTHRTRVGAHLVKNKYLEKTLDKYNQNTQEVWTSIITNKGSVQHLDFLDDYDKEIYKTAFEIDQAWVVEHAADRQIYICQGQSVNLFFPHGSDRSYINFVHLSAYRKGLKGLYYYRTEAARQADQVSKQIKRERLSDIANQEECVACQG